MSAHIEWTHAKHTAVEIQPAGVEIPGYDEPDHLTLFLMGDSGIGIEMPGGIAEGWDLHRRLGVTLARWEASGQPDRVIVQDDEQECRRCEDTVQCLSSDGLCDGCVQEETTVPADHIATYAYVLEPGDRYAVKGTNLADPNAWRHIGRVDASLQLVRVWHDRQDPETDVPTVHDTYARVHVARATD